MMLCRNPLIRQSSHDARVSRPRRWSSRPGLAKKPASAGPRRLPRVGPPVGRPWPPMLPAAGRYRASRGATRRQRTGLMRQESVPRSASRGVARKMIRRGNLHRHGRRSAHGSAPSRRSHRPAAAVPICRHSRSITSYCAEQVPVRPIHRIVGFPDAKAGPAEGHGTRSPGARWPPSRCRRHGPFRAEVPVDASLRAAPTAVDGVDARSRPRRASTPSLRLDVGDDLDGRHDRPQIPCQRRLPGQQNEAVVSSDSRTRRDDGRVVTDHPARPRPQVGVQQR